MAAVRIEEEAFGDRRYDVLAQILGLPDADCARGKMAAVWRQCTQETKHVLSAEMVRAILGENGPDALLKSCLGEPVEGGIRIRGTEGRIEWLTKIRKNGRKGGRPAQTKTEPRPNQKQTKTEPEPNPLALATAIATSSPSERSIAPGAPRNPSGPHQLAIAEFEGYFQRTHQGAKPSWKGRNAALMAALVKTHGLHEITRRIAVLEKTPPPWPIAPWDMPTFSQHFDKIAQPATRAGDVKSGRVEPHAPEAYKADGVQPW